MMTPNKHNSKQHPMHYGDYLHLDEVLNAQHTLSPAHDEMLFIIQHQTSELWLKLALHELRAAMALIEAGKLEPSFKMLARVSRILEQLNSAWDVLRTMTPSEYTEFRTVLGESSGFQSWQYRALEFVLGNKNPAMMKPHEHRESYHALLEQLMNNRSLYDISIGLLSTNGLVIDDAVLQRDWRVPHEYNDSVLNAWETVYRQTEQYWSLYQLAEKLVDIEDYFRRWRFNHLTTVMRIIGDKTGTGGTSGGHYLKRRLDVVLFPELWALRTNL